MSDCVALLRTRLTISVVMVFVMMIRWTTCGLCVVGIISGKPKASPLSRVV